MVACKHKIVALDMLLHCPTCIIISLTIMLIKTALFLLHYLHFDSAKKSKRSLFLNTFVVTCTSSLFCVQCCFSFTLSHLWFSSIHCHLLFIFFNCCLTAISSSYCSFICFHCCLSLTCFISVSPSSIAIYSSPCFALCFELNFIKKKSVWCIVVLTEVLKVAVE